MATVAATRKPERRRRRWVMWGIIALVVLGLIAAAVTLAQGAAQQAAQTAAAANWRTEEVKSGPIDASVSATGDLAAKAEANLQFQATGNVTKILVNEGDRVTAGQPLAQIDAADLELGVVRAEADLKQATADYDKLVAGASKEEIAQAEAQVKQARGQYTQTSGSVTKADIAAARARLEQAKAELARIQAGPAPENRRASEAALQQAQTNLANQRDSLSAAKTNAQIGVERAVNSLTQAQTAYSSAKHNWDYVQETGNDPVQPDITGATGKSSPNTLNEAQRQQYRDAFIQAETNLRSAEAAVKQAQVEYDTARQNEAVGVQSAEQQVAKAQADLSDVNAGAKADERAAAQASVASAQADLDKLLGANRSGGLAAAQAGVESAEAALAKLTASASPNDLAVAQASVDRADAALKQAQRSLEQATLTAPFDGTVTKINIRVGESAATAGASASTSSGGAIDLADLSAYHVDVPIDELDVAQVEPGQTARVTLDAVPNAPIKGKVVSIAPVATRNEQGTTTYSVRVDLNQSETRVMPGMSASVDIVTNAKDNAVLVPRRAIQTDNGKNFVWIPTGGAAEPGSNRPASERRDVTLGLSNAEYVEVTSGLKAGDNVLVAATTSTLNPFEANN